MKIKALIIQATAVILILTLGLVATFAWFNFDAQSGDVGFGTTEKRYKYTTYSLAENFDGALTNYEWTASDGFGSELDLNFGTINNVSTLSKSNIVYLKAKIDDAYVGLSENDFFANLSISSSTGIALYSAYRKSFV